jgi:serine/threonine protein kinase
MTEDLHSYLDRRLAMDKERRFPLPLLGAVDIMLHIAKGVNYLHEHHVVHRDLKPGNVLITVVKDVENLEPSWAWHVKITDFGLSKLKEAGSQYSTLDVGTRAFMAPEVFNVEDNKDKNYTKAADVYSYAMIFFEVLTGKPPFEGVPRREIFERIKKGKRPNLPSEAYCPEYLSAFIRRCWATEAKERPKFPDICQMLVYCKELILRDSVPSPKNYIVDDNGQKLSVLGLKCRKGNLLTKLFNDTRKTLVLYEEASNAAQIRLCELQGPNEECTIVLETNPGTGRTNLAGKPSFYVHSVDPNETYSALPVWCRKEVVVAVSTDEMIDNDVIIIRQEDNAFIKHCKPRYEIFAKNSNN